MSDKKLTIFEVAKRAGVSIGAVSRILSNDPKLNVRAETRETVLKVISELGYEPNLQARGLRMARTNSFAMIVPEIDSPAFPAIIEGAQIAASERGYSMLLGGVGEHGEDPTLAERLVRRNRIDGLLISTGRREPSKMTELQSLKVPYVLVNRFLDDRTPHIVLDDFAGAFAMTEYLAKLGHRRIAFVGEVQRFLGVRRVGGYRQALGSAGLDFDPSLIIDAGYTREGGEAGMRALSEMSKPPTAIFATNNLVAAGLMVTAQQLGFVLPRDLSVASFYDGPVCELLNPSLTAVRFPLQKLGADSTNMLLNLIEGADIEIAQQISFERIVERASTAPPSR